MTRRDYLQGSLAGLASAGSTLPVLALPHTPSKTGFKLSELFGTDAILDRLVHNAHRLILKGESLRKTAAKRQKLDAEPVE